jgi:pyridoxamine 5'-phosphate oxidase
MKSLSSQRQDYCQGALRRADLKKIPMEQFDLWFQEASMCDAITEPNAMSLSTANCDLLVTSRMVLLKGYEKDGFRFFTNSTSIKGRHIAENPNVALLFYWPPLERQVRINGTASLLPRVETEKYFHSRPRNSQLAACASFQSMTLSNRHTLESRMQELKKKYKNPEVPVPDFWNGYLVAPHSMQFWQGRSDRLHDCFQYTKKESAWIIERLNP